MITVTSCFSQLLSLIDRAGFARAVKQHQAERGAKGFSCWDQFVSMLFCQMGAAHSLREICGGLGTAMGKLVHLGMREAPSRSTLAYANNHRPWQVYQTVFEDLLTQCQALAARKKRRFRFKNPLRSLDGSVIELCVSVFDWARFQRTKRSNCTCNWIIRAICRVARCSPTPTPARLASPARWSLLLARL
jgi:Domain of unknown function (DUF4372)